MVHPMYDHGSGLCVYVIIDYLFKRLGIKIKAVAPHNHQSLQVEHGVKTLATKLTNHLTALGQ